MDEPRELDVDALALLAELTAQIETDIQPGEITADDYVVALARQGTRLTLKTAEAHLQAQASAGMLLERWARINGRRRRVWRKAQ